MTKSYLTFSLADSPVYGLPTKKIREVLLHERFSPLHQVPPFILGVTNIRDEIIPVIDPGLLLGASQPATLHKESCYIVIWVNSNQNNIPVCLLVDRIRETYAFDDNILRPSVICDRYDINYLTGVGRIGAKLKLLINIDALLNPYLQLIAESLSNSNNQDNFSEKQSESIKSRQRPIKLLGAWVNDKPYAFPLKDIVQIITHQPSEYSQDIPSILHSMQFYQGKPLGVISLQALFKLDHLDDDSINDVNIRDDLNEADTKPKNNTENILDIQHLEEKLIPDTKNDKDHKAVIMFEQNSYYIGMLVDKLGSVYGKCQDDLQDNELCRLVDRKRIQSLGIFNSKVGNVEVIDPFFILNDAESSKIDAWYRTLERLMQGGHPKENKIESRKLKSEFSGLAGAYLVVMIGEHAIGLPSNIIQEILSDSELTSIPNVQHDFMGLLDLRGDLCPIISMRHRFEVGKVENDARPCILMINGDKRYGIMVDEVIDWVNITEQHILAEILTKLCVTSECIKASAEIDGRIITLIDFEKSIAIEKINMREVMEEIEKG